METAVQRDNGPKFVLFPTLSTSLWIDPMKEKDISYKCATLREWDMTSGKWVKGYTQSEPDDAHRKFNLIFPPDLVALLRDRRPADGHLWTDEAAIKQALEWPIESLLSSIERGFIWRQEWSEKPTSSDVRKEAAQSFIARAPKLIPLLSHRYLPETPHEVGNPVFSNFYSDVIYIGVDLADYFERELTGNFNLPRPGQLKQIPFWSDLVVGNGWTTTPINRPQTS
jgi:hypothetical protein